MYPVDVCEAAAPWAAAVLLHPHPDFGGNRFNLVVDSLYRALPTAGVTAARFDFSSSDEAGAVDRTVEVVHSVPTRPLVLVGYSFGAAIATLVTDDRLAGWFLAAPPLRPGAQRRPPIADDPRPKALAVPQFDQFSPPADVRRLTDDWVNATVEVVAGADHFLAGGTTEVVTQLLAWLRSPAVGSVGGNDSSLPTSS
jgi:alpha/beta superfamily hydrolase